MIKVTKVLDLKKEQKGRTQIEFTSVNELDLLDGASVVHNRFVDTDKHKYKEGMVLSFDIKKVVSKTELRKGQKPFTDGLFYGTKLVASS